MLHLLPQYQKNKVIKEYRMRLGIVFVAVMLFAVLIFMIFTLPVYMSLVSEKNTLESKKSGYQNTINLGSKNDSGGVTDITKEMEALAPYKNSIAPNLFIDSLSAGSDGIKIDGFALSQAKPTDPVNVVLSGVAKTREDLSAFAQLLNARFGGVKLPLSSLVNQANIPFDFRFTMDYTKAMKVKTEVDAASRGKVDVPNTIIIN